MRVELLIVLGLVACKDAKNAPPPKATTAEVEPRSDAAKERTLAEELEAIRMDTKLPALAAAVWRDGKVVESAAVGLRKVDDPASKVTTTDLWHLGSNTKAMTATLIGIYVDRGTLEWTDTVATLFKGWKVDPGYAKVTLDQLIRHTGGAPGEPPAELWKQLWDDGDKPDARAKFVKGILAKPPAQKPGTFVYSNASYMIAGAALEKATGKRWEQLMHDELFEKLGMASCGFGAPGRREGDAAAGSAAAPGSAAAIDQPWGHDQGGTPIAPGPAADNPPGLGPAGTVHCSLDDYGKFLALHATGEPAIVKPETLEHLHDAPNMEYAGGWMVLATPKGSLLVHSGSNTMWYVTAMVALAKEPEKRLSFVMATNSGSNVIESVFDRLVNRHTKK